MEQLQASLSLVKLLRTTVAQVFETLGNGISIENGSENQFQQELHEILTSANTRLRYVSCQIECNKIIQNIIFQRKKKTFSYSRDLESSINGLTPPPAPFSLGNTSYLSQETTQDRQALYSQLVNSYKWIDKVHEYGSMAATMLSTNALKRSYFNNSNKRRRPLTSSHNISPMYAIWHERFSILPSIVESKFT